MMTINIPNFQSFSKEFQFAMRFIAEESDLGYAQSQILDDLSQAISEKFKILPDVAQTLSSSLYAEYQNYKNAGQITRSYGQAMIYSRDRLFLLKNTPFFYDEDRNVQRLVLAFLLYYHANYHPSGWIRYDKKSIFYLANCQKLPTSLQENLTRYIHTTYNLNMRVVGSNQPIPCYSLDWAKPEPDDSGIEDTPDILGELSPEFLESYLSQLCKEEYTGSRKEGVEADGRVKP